MKAQELCMALVHADNPDEVVGILQKAGYWDDHAVWRDLGDNENNYAVIGAQQSDPIAALVEKVVNSIDARLMNECLINKIDPTSKEAPTSVRRAIAGLIEGSDPDKTANGRLEHWVPKQRREQAEYISISTTGSKTNPCLSISDLGEGQTPAAVPDTFMSLAKSNKLRIPFVQGKFNMGGTGALRFCGGLHHFQLVLTRRNPALLPDGADNPWSFTIVRRMEPTNGERSSVYRYLAPIPTGDEKKPMLLTFNADSLPIRPQGNNAYALAQEYGAFIKLYHYEYTYRSHVLLSDGLLRQIDTRLPNPALPYMMHECRAYKGDSDRSFANPATGVLVRLADDKGDNLEKDFPKHDEMVVAGQKFRVSLFGFKAKKAATYLNRSEGVLFVVNGQTHGTLSPQIFTRSKVGLDYVADSLMVSLDCSELTRTALEELFMNSRESLAKSEFRTAVERELEDVLNHHPLLREFNNRRREEKIKEKAEDNSSLEDTLKEILSSSPSLASIFLGGQKLKTPFNIKQSAASDKFDGKLFPSYFRFRGRAQDDELKRKAEKGRAIRLSFETDVEDNYFGRSKEPGSYTVEQELNGAWVAVTQRSMNVYRGNATLTITLEGAEPVGKQVPLRVTVSDDQMLEPLVSSAKIELIPYQDHDISDSKKQKNKNPKKDGTDTTDQAGIELPTATWIGKADWDDYGFNDHSVLRVLRADSGAGKAKFDFFLNEDNVHLLNELKHAKGKEDLVREQFRVGMLLLGMSVIHGLGKDADGDVVRDRADQVTNAAALVLIPMIRHLGKLDLLLKPKLAEAA
ncbi:MAG: hypothetical protein QOJ94_1001 [Sphingomonadales bacterium]|jgi:hypothetical protein|nr:hypothetical protein [Sphingomonadales bacterium]